MIKAAYFGMLLFLGPFVPSNGRFMPFHINIKEICRYN